MNRYDVIVVGAGPGGSTCAKACAEKGLKVLILEKQGLPRDKVCSGMVMGALAKGLIRKVYGDPPRDVLTRPVHLMGYCLHVPGIGMEKIDNLTWLTWRRDLDHWMSREAQRGGAEIWDRTEVIGLNQKEGVWVVLGRRDGEDLRLASAYVIGADGAASYMRRCLFPDLKVTYGQALQEHFEGEVDLDRDYFHWFYPPEIYPSFVTVHQKDGRIIMEVAGRPGSTKALMEKGKAMMADRHGLKVRPETILRGSCLEPALHRELTSRTFCPGKENALLVGDAAGFIMPVSGEGIGVAMQSALAAATAVSRSMESRRSGDEIYQQEIEPIIARFEQTTPWFRKIAEEARRGGASLPGVLKEAYESTLKNPSCDLTE